MNKITIVRPKGFRNQIYVKTVQNHKYLLKQNKIVIKVDAIARAIENIRSAPNFTTDNVLRIITRNVTSTAQADEERGLFLTAGFERANLADLLRKCGDLTSARREFGIAGTDFLRICKRLKENGIHSSGIGSFLNIAKNYFRLANELSVEIRKQG